MLDDDNEYWLQNANLVGIVHCALNTEPFLDFSSYLASLPSSDDAPKQFNAFRDAAERIIKAQNYIDSMMKLQAKQPLIAPDPSAAARNNADQIKDEYKRADAINSLIASELKAGDITGAQKTADLFQVDDYNYNNAQCKIGEAQAKVGDITGAHETFASALKIANQIQDASWKPIRQGSIAAAQANTGDIADALKTADLIQDADIKIEALQGIAAAQASGGDVAGALKTADILRDAGTNQLWKAQTFQAIAKAQAKTGDIAGAFKTADLIQDTSYKTSAISDIAAAQANTGDIAGAQKTTGLLPNDEPNQVSKSYAQYAIAAAQAKAGDIAGARKTADLIQDARYKAFAQMAIAKAE